MTLLLWLTLHCDCMSLGVPRPNRNPQATYVSPVDSTRAAQFRVTPGAIFITQPDGRVLYCTRKEIHQ